MLLINGYTGIVAQKLGLAPPGGRMYWPTSIKYVARLLNDLNFCFIHPNSGIFSTAKNRFNDGYDFAFYNEKKLIDHINLCENNLKILAHSQGVAFAEGIAAFLYEEKNIKTQLLLALNGEQMASTPQNRLAIEKRIVFRTEKDYVTNKFNQNLNIREISIIEHKLRSGFIKYSFFKTVNENAPDSTLYFKGRYTFMNAHIAHSHRPNLVWRAVRHALLLLNESDFTNESDYSSNINKPYRQPYSQN